MAASILQKFKEGSILNPSESRQFANILNSIKNVLTSANVESRILPLKIYIGTGTSWKGVLNLLFESGHEVYLYGYTPETAKNMVQEIQQIMSNDVECLRLLAPLNLYDNRELANFIHTHLNVPIYPLNYNIITSKWMLHLLFAPHIPKTFFFPEDTKAIHFIEKIKEIANKEKISWFFLKDEYDSDYSGLVPYIITPIEQFEKYLQSFYEKIEGISNVGGLLIEEFLSTNGIINVYKGYFFNELYLRPFVHIKTILNGPKEGCLFKSAVSGIKEEISEIPKDQYNKFNPILNQYYPYLFSSFDYILSNDTPKIIDINSSANIWDFIFKNSKIDLNQMFLKFISKIIQLPNKEGLAGQQQNWALLQHLYTQILKLGPCFISGEKILCLQDDREFLIKDFLTEIQKGDKKQ